MGSMVGLDTNVFIYILERHPDFFKPASAALAAAVATGQAVCVPTLLITEVLAGTRGKTALNFFANDSFEFYDLTEPIAILAGELCYKNVSLKPADAVHLATARLAGASQFITNDRRLFSVDAGIDVVPLKNFGSGD